MAGCRWVARQCARQLRSPLRLSYARTVGHSAARGSIPARRTYATSVAAAELQFGQPLHETHPHLLSPGECK